MVCHFLAGRHADCRSGARGYLHRHEGTQLLNETQDLTLLHLITLSQQQPVVSLAGHLRHLSHVEGEAATNGGNTTHQSYHLAQ